MWTPQTISTKLPEIPAQSPEHLWDELGIISAHLLHTPSATAESSGQTPRRVEAVMTTKGN